MKVLKLLTILLFAFQYASTAFSDETEITISIGPRGFGEMTPRLIEGFMKENPHIKVNWQKISDVPNESRKLYVTNKLCSSQNKFVPFKSSDAKTWEAKKSKKIVSRLVFIFKFI